jgi:hypothetical protein
MHLQVARGECVICSRRFAILPSLLAGLLLLAGCPKPTEPASAVRIEHEVLPRPFQVGVSTITLTLMDAGGRPIDGARIRLEGMMTHPGMRPSFSEAREAGSGRYQSSIEFGMAGDWIVLLRITLPNGQKLDRQIDVKGVLPA